MYVCWEEKPLGYLRSIHIDLHKTPHGRGANDAKMVETVPTHTQSKWSLLGDVLVPEEEVMKILLGLLCGIAIGVASVFAYLVYLFKDVMR